MLKLTFLGTGTSQGMPVVSCPCWVCASMDARDKRLRCSAMVTLSSGANIVIDAGMDFRAQMLRQGVKSIAALLITHEHKDHVGGLDDVRAFNYTSGQSIELFATEHVQQTLIKDFDYAFEKDPYPGVPRINLNTIDSEPFYVEGQEIIPIIGGHYRIPVTGFRIENLAYLTDFKTITDSEKQKLRGLDVLVINGLRRERHISHFSVSEAVALAREVGAKQIYLTHISHELGSYALVSEELPQNVHLAYDGLQIQLD